MKDLILYVDNTSIKAETEEGHLRSLDEISTILFENCVRLELSKFYVGRQDVGILSHKVTSEVVLPSDRHVESIKRLIESR